MDHTPCDLNHRHDNNVNSTPGAKCHDRSPYTPATSREIPNRPNVTAATATTHLATYAPTAGGVQYGTR